MNLKWKITVFFHSRRNAKYARKAANAVIPNPIGLNM